MAYLDPPEFYPSWPKYGKRLSFQWGESRKNADTLKILTRSLSFDEHIAKYLDSAVAGYEYGEDGFHNHFRTFYDKDTNNWLVQFNSATEASPVWVNYLTVNSAGVVTFSGSFYTATLDVRAGGDSGPVPPTVTQVRHLIFHSDNFYITQNSLSQPIVNFKGGAGTGDITNATNLAAEGVFASKSGTNLQFKGLVAGSNITITPAANTLTIASTATGGGGFYGIGVVQSDNKQGYSGINVLSFEAANFYIERNVTDPDKVQINLRPSAATGSGTITGGASLGGDEPVYGTTTAPTINIKGLTAGTGITLSSDANAITVTNTGPTVSQIGPGFYGIGVVQSDNLRGYSGINTLSFEAANFYITRNTTDRDKVQINLRPSTVPTNSGAAQDFSVASEWAFNHNLNTRNVTWAVYDLSGQAFIPQRVDTSNPNIAYFYVSQSTAGKAVVLALGAGSGITGGTALGGDQAIFDGAVGPNLTFKGITAGANITLTSNASAVTIAAASPNPGFYGITVGQTGNNPTFKNINVVKFAASDFYINQNAPNTDEVVVNLRNIIPNTDSIAFQIEVPHITNYFLDSGAFRSYTLNKVRILTEEGACGVEFYIRTPARNGGQTNPGIGVVGLNLPLVNKTRQEATSTGNNVVADNAELIMSVFYIHSNPKSLRGNLKITY